MLDDYGLHANQGRRQHGKPSTAEGNGCPRRCYRVGSLRIADSAAAPDDPREHCVFEVIIVAGEFSGQLL